MIFKTINSSVDEARKTLALFNKDWNTYKRNWQNANGVFGKIGSVFTPANAITKSDIEAIKAYNSQIDSCVTSQTAFNRTMLNASPAAQNLVASYNGGKVSAQDMATAQNAAKASTIGLTIAQTALNAAIGMGIGLLISLVVKGIDKLVHANEEAIEKAEELRRKYEEFKSTNESNVTTLNGLKKEFEELSKGVSQYGDNISLTTEQYERYKEIIQQIVGMSPSLAEGYSTENGYIADKNGLLERAIELQEIEYRNELRKITNLQNLKTSMAGYIAEYKDAFEGGWVTENMSATSTVKATDFSNVLYKAFNYSERYNDGYSSEDLAREILKSLGIDNIDKEMEKFFNENGYYQPNWFFDKYVDEIAKNIDAITNALSYENVGLEEDEFENRILTVKDCAQAYLDMKDSISMANESIQRNLQYIAEYADGYSNLTTEQQKFVNEFLKGFNIDDIVSRDWFGNLTYDEDKMKSVKRQIIDFVEALSQNETTKSALADLYAIPTDEQSISEFVEQFRNALEIIKAYCQENRIEIPIAITDSEQTINSLEAQYQRAVDFAKDKFDDYDPTTFFKEHSINTQEEIDAWQEIAQGARDAAEAEKEYIQGSTLNENPISFSDIFSLKSTDDTVTNLGKISESIDTIQNAYKTLYDAIEEYNEEGAFSVDTLQSVIALGDDWLDYLVDEDGTLKLDKESLEELTQARLNDMRVQAINNVIDNVSKVQDDASANEYLKTTNYALAESYEEVAQKALESANAQMQAAVAAGTLSQANMDAAMNKANADISKINKLFANTGISTSSITGKSGKSSSNSSSTGDYEEQFDFFERRVEVLDNAVSLLKANLENLTGSFAKNQLLDQNSSILEERMRNYSDAVRMYQEKAQESLSKLDLETQKKIIDGSISLTDYIGEGNKAVVEAMNDYKGWSDKVAKCTEELSSLKEELRQLELNKFNHIIQDFTDQFDLRDNAKNLIGKQIDLFKEAGELIGESFYTAQIDQSQKQLTLLENEKAQLVNQMTSAIGSGRVQKDTEEWLEMVNALSDVDGNILDCKKSIEEFDNAILNLHTEVFNRIQEQFSDFDSEISSIVDLFDDFEVSDDKGLWSKEGIAQLGLLSQQYELAQYRVQQYSDEIDKLNAQYLSGKYSATEYGDKLAELSSGQWDAVQASESAKDAIMDLNEARVDNAVKGIEKEIDAYKELIDAQLDALRASKDLHDYEKSIAEKTKSVTDLERQIAAMQNDTSAATVAKRKQLEQQLADAKADLEEAEYQHSIEVQEDALNKQYEAYEKERNNEIDKLRVSLNDKETILAESFNTVKNNAALVGQEIATITTQHGITVSNALISSWQSGKNAIASYGEVLSQNTSVFIGNIMGVENEVWNLQAQVNTTADSLAWMFSTKADNLVNELNTSYFAEANLASMTSALQQSLISTLERGYDISSIVNSLNSIVGAANSAKTAIDNLNTSNAQDLLVTDVGSHVGENMYYLQQQNQIQESQQKKTKKATQSKSVGKYASGAKYIEEDQLAITNEAGQELIYHAADGSILTPLRQGDKVFGNEAVNRLWQLGQGLIPPDMTKNLAMPTVLPNNVNNNSVNVHYDSMITVQGSLNSTDVKQMEAIVDRGINKLVNRLHDGLTYGK